MKKLLIVLAIAAPLSVASLAGAGPNRKDNCAKAKAKGKACELVFKAEGVKGDRPIGDGTTIMSRLQTRFGNLLKFRMHFNDKILKEADGI